MLVKGFIKLFYLLLISSAIVGCNKANVGKVAQCGSNQAYDAITRKCYDVTIPNRPPQPTLEKIQLTENQTLPTEVELTYIDVDKDKALSCRIVHRANGINDRTYGCTCQNGKCFAKFLPNRSFFGHTSFIYTVTDKNGESAGKEVLVEVLGINHAPISKNRPAVTINEDQTLRDNFNNFAEDIDGQKLSFRILTQPRNGRVSAGFSNGDFAYVPNQNYYGFDSFKFIASDGELDSDPIEVAINLLPVNDPPIAEDVNFTMVENTVSDWIPLKFTDVENDIATSCEVISPDAMKIQVVNCRCLQSPGGSYCEARVQGLNHFFGAIDLAYTISSDDLQSNLATVHLNVEGVNDAPTLDVRSLPFVETESNPRPEFIEVTGFDIDEGGLYDFEQRQSIDLKVVTKSSDVPVAKLITEVKVYYGDLDVTNTLDADGFYHLGDGITPIDGSKVLVRFYPHRFNAGNVNLEFVARDDGEPAKYSNVVELPRHFQFMSGVSAPVFNERIDDQVVNEGFSPFTNGVTINEGLADSDNALDVTLSVLSSSNQNLLPVSNVKFFARHQSLPLEKRQEFTGVIPTSYINSFGQTEIDLDSDHFVIYLQMIPVSGVTGSSEVVILADNGNKTSTMTFNFTVRAVGAKHGGWNKLNAFGGRNDHLGKVLSTPEVTLGWNNFKVSSSDPMESTSILGWNIYRRNLNESYDWNNPVNLNAMVPNNQREFKDTTVENEHVYFYTVRPVDVNGLPIATKEVFTEVRIFVPAVNQVFVHRWMVNLEVCSMMNNSVETEDPDKLIDATANFSCAYVGPGATVDRRYDIGSDLVVDAVEAGCPYSKAPSCSPDGCIGTRNPVASTDNTGLIFYNRKDGTCKVSNGTDWVDITKQNISKAIARSVTSSHLPPFTNISQASAEGLCEARELGFTLPTRRQQIAYSAWANTFDDQQINEIEYGNYLNVSSKCNAAEASGLVNAYTDTEVPNSSSIFSLPGTKNSGIRSIYTGSSQVGANYLTEICQSRYGIQDVYGNVSEWTQDQFKCFGPLGSDGLGTDAYTCTALSPDYNIDDLDNTFGTYKLDGLRGPCQDNSLNDGVCDAPMTSWAIEKANNLSGNFIFPLGLPAKSDYRSNFPHSEVLDYLLTIGTTAGIETASFHGDVFAVNSYSIYNSEDQIASVATGGSYKGGDNANAGRYTMELIPAKVVDDKEASRILNSTYTISVLHENELQFDHASNGQFEVYSARPINGAHYKISFVQSGAQIVIAVAPGSPVNVTVNYPAGATVNDVVNAFNHSDIGHELALFPKNAGVENNTAVGATLDTKTMFSVRTRAPSFGQNMKFKFVTGAQNYVANPFLNTSSTESVSGQNFAQIVDAINNAENSKMIAKGSGNLADIPVRFNSNEFNFSPKVSYQLTSANSDECVVVTYKEGTPGISKVIVDNTHGSNFFGVTGGQCTQIIVSHAKNATYGDICQTLLDNQVNLNGVLDFNCSVGDDNNSFVTDLTTAEIRDEYLRFVVPSVLLSAQQALPDGKVNLEFKEVRNTSQKGANYIPETKTAGIQYLKAMNSLDFVGTINSATELSNVLVASLISIGDGFISGSNLSTNVYATSNGSFIAKVKERGESWNSQVITFNDIADSSRPRVEYNNGNHIIVYVHAGVTRMGEVLNMLNTNPALKATYSKFLCADGTEDSCVDEVAGVFSNISLQGGVSKTSNARSDVGFRCVAPVNYPHDLYFKY